MSLLILSFDTSSDRIGTHLNNLLNSSSKSPHIVSLCRFEQLFHSSDSYEKIFSKSLQNDLLGFLILIDIATTNRLHIQYLSSIKSLLCYLVDQHPFQSILCFIHHANPLNQLYTSALTCFNLSLLLLHLYPFVNGLIFNSIDQIIDHQQYHSILAEQLARIFRPVSSLRENTIKNTSIEFLQFIQHLLNNPEKKILFIKNENFKKYFSLQSNALLFIQRGQPTSNIDFKIANFDLWNSYEKNLVRLQEILIVNNDQLTQQLLEQSIIKPLEKKLNTNHAYFYWLTKKYSISNLEHLLNNGISLCKNILFDQ